MATSGGGERDWAAFIDTVGIAVVEIVIGVVSDAVEQLLVRAGADWFRNRWDEIGTNCGA